MTESRKHHPPLLILDGQPLLPCIHIDGYGITLHLIVFHIEPVRERVDQRSFIILDTHGVLRHRRHLHLTLPKLHRLCLCRQTKQQGQQ